MTLSASRVTKAWWGLTAMLFSAAVYLQLNDPDPVLWGAIYGGVAVMSFAALLDRLPVLIAAVAAILYLAGALWLSPSLLASSRDAFSGVQMMNVEHERVREAWGMVICAAWAATLWLYARAGKQAGGRASERTHG